ncbi:hypothetical protein SOPP22_17135 [Shewanella sp. OPT22]|nr:hypothetical protein SOPP22_17135 [Shewanella sp. OPT22]
MSLDTLKAYTTCLYEQSPTNPEQLLLPDNETSDLKARFSFASLGDKKRVEFFPKFGKGTNYALELYITENQDGLTQFHVTHCGYKEGFQPFTPIKQALREALNVGERYQVTEPQRFNRSLINAPEFKSPGEKRSWLDTQTRLRKAKIELQLKP